MIVNDRCLLIPMTLTTRMSLASPSAMERALALVGQRSRLVLSSQTRPHLLSDVRTQTS